MATLLYSNNRQFKQSTSVLPILNINQASVARNKGEFSFHYISNVEIPSWYAVEFDNIALWFPVQHKSPY